MVLHRGGCNFHAAALTKPEILFALTRIVSAKKYANDVMKNSTTFNGDRY